MFPRIATSKKKSAIYEYLVISESVHVKGKGSTTRNIATLGNIKKFKTEDVENIIDGLIRLFQVEKYSLSDQVQIIESLEHGSIIFWQKIWNKMNLSKTIRTLIRRQNKKIKIDAEKYVEIMVINRCIDPLSKLGATRWIERTCYKAMKGYHDLNFDVEYFYRSMDYLLSIKDELEFSLYEKMKTIFSINVKLTFYDITSTFFYTDNCPIGKKGYSRDHRFDKEQIVIGVVTSYEGYPIKHYVFDGNTKDETTVIEVVKKLKKEYNIEETTFVGDRGMITKLNLSTIVEEGFEYIMGVKFRQSEIHAMLFDDKGLDDTKYQNYNGLKILEESILIKDFLLWKITKISSEKGIKIHRNKFKQIESLIFSLTNKSVIEPEIMRKTLAGAISNSKVRGRISTLIRKYKGQYENEVRTIICLNEERKCISKTRRDRKISDLSELISDLFAKANANEEAAILEGRLDKIFEGNKRRYRRFFKILYDSSNKIVGYTLLKFPVFS